MNHRRNVLTGVLSVVAFLVLLIYALTAPDRPESIQESSAAVDDGDADPATPKTALIRIIHERERGDATAALLHYHTTSPLEKSYAVLQNTVAMEQLRLAKTLLNRFGPSETVDQLMTVARTDIINEAAEIIDSDTATILFPGWEIEMVRINGAWKIDVSRQISYGQERWGDPPIDEKLERLQRNLAILRQTIDEIEAGRYASTDAAMDAFEQRMRDARIAG